MFSWKITSRYLKKSTCTISSYWIVLTYLLRRTSSWWIIYVLVFSHWSSFYFSVIPLPFSKWFYNKPPFWSLLTKSLQKARCRTKTRYSLVRPSWSSKAKWWLLFLVWQPFWSDSARSNFFWLISYLYFSFSLLTFCSFFS